MSRNHGVNFPSHFITTFKGILQCFENILFQSRSLFGSALIYIWCYGSVLGPPHAYMRKHRMPNGGRAQHTAVLWPCKSKSLRCNEQQQKPSTEQASIQTNMILRFKQVL